MPAYLLPTPFLAQMMRQESARFLVHTYSRTPRATVADTGTGDPATDPAVDDWGQPIRVTQPTVSNISCFYQHDKSVVVVDSALVQLNQPVLTVASNDPIQPGDVVTNIATLPDPANRIPAMLIEAGPFIVESLYQQDPYYGSTLFNQAILRKLDIIPNDFSG